MAEYSADQVGRRVKALRIAKGYDTQAAFAAAIGARRGEVASWESAQKRPSLEKAQPMVSHFGITLDWLYYGDTRHLTHELALALDAASREPGIAPPAEAP